MKPTKLRALVAGTVRACARSLIQELDAGSPFGYRRQLNCGWCMDVADYVYGELSRRGVPAVVLEDDCELRLPSGHHVFDDTPTHTWVYVPHVGHVDSEAPAGCAHWAELPHFRRWTAPCAEDPVPLVIRPRLPKGEERDWLNRSAAYCLRVWRHMQRREEQLP